MRGGSGLLLAAAATTASTESFQCGPTPHEAGQLVLMVTPAAYAIDVALVTLLLWLWRTRAPVWPPRWTRLAALGAVHCVLAALAWPSLQPAPDGTPSHIDPGTLILALWFYGTSYATVMLVTLRIAIRAAPRQAALAPHLLQLVVFSVPAMLLAHDALAGTWFMERNHTETYFVAAGQLGWIPGPIFVLLLGEILIRRRLARRTPA